MKSDRLLDEQRAEYWEKWTDQMTSQLQAGGWAPNDLQLFFRAFKAEQELELWMQSGSTEKWRLFNSWKFCSSSGELGPKRREGDRQIPEGCYHIDRFNPKSRFHLSLGLNYPNASDRKLGHPQKPGSDIFIHGGCSTVGCIPITDPEIEKVYLLATWARENGQQEIPVYIFPFRFSEENWKTYGPKFPQHLNFWKQLQAIYQDFESSRQLRPVQIGSSGDYSILQ